MENLVVPVEERLHALGGRDPQTRWSREWDGRWRLVLFDVPKAHNTHRARLRRYLRDKGFGYLQNSVWITPDPLEEERQILGGGKINVESLLLLEARPCAGESDAEIVAGAWDFERINRRYARHLKILGERPGGALRNDAAAKALLRWAAAEREAWLDAVTNDPLLPQRILPTDYLGHFPKKKKAPPPKSAANGNGAQHVVAEAVEAIAHRPFDPKKLEAGLHTRVDRGFLDYASYVIRDRAIPNLADGLKPVQRRILWALHEKDDGRFIKVANVVGHTMQYHPHGDASIGDALVVLANKRYLIEGQGNFGNIFTGDPAAAPRYIECRLTELARTELFNDEITEFVPSYDGRNKGAGHAAVQTAAHAHARHGRHRGRIGRADFAAQFSRAARSADRDSQEAAVQVPAGFSDRRPDGRARLSGRQRQRESARQDQGEGRIHRRHQRNSAHDHDRFAHRFHRRRGAEGQAQGQIHQRFHVRERRDRDQMSGGRGRGEIGGCALRLHRLRSHHRQPHRRHQGQPPGGVDGVRSAAREHGATWWTR